MNRQRAPMGKPPTRSHRILALVPPEQGRSDASGDSSGEEGEESYLFRNRAFSDISSENPSIDSSLERLDLLSEDSFGPTLDPDQNFFAQESNSEDETAPSHIRSPCFIPESDTECEHSSPHILQNTTSPKTNTNYAGDEIQVILPEESSPIAVMPSCSSWNGDLPSIPSNISSLPSEPFPTPSTSTVNKKKSPPAKRSSKRKIAKQQKPAPAKKKTTCRRNIVQPTYEWKNTKFLHRAEISEDTFNADIPVNKSSLQYFYDFFSEDILDEIVQNTNLYSVQQTGRSIIVTKNDMRDFLSIKLMMGIISAPSYLDYWASKTRCGFIADLMTLKRYQQIRRYLHFVDNTVPDTDPYFKIRPFIEKIRQNCLKVEEENRFSIDEMTIPYKGRKAGKKKQYNPQKPRKWGFKNLVRAGVSGIIYDFFLYCGEDSFRCLDIHFDNDEMLLGWGAKAVIALCKTIKRKACVVYFDNFFSSLALVQMLRQKYGIFSLGTIRCNRLRGCEKLLIDDKTLKKRGRGASVQLVCNKNQISVVKWYDNKCVTLVSSYVDSYPKETTNRYDKVEKRKIPVNFPQIVKHYNAHMGGVDLADMLVALYRTEMKSRRWYLSIFSQMIDICINNAWLMYKRNMKRLGEKPMMLKKFRLNVSEELIKFGRPSLPVEVPRISSSKKIAAPKRSRPCDDIRRDKVSHEQAGTTYGRCRYCKKGQTNVFCTKCQLRLCFIPNKRNCFYNFHND